MNLKTIVLVFCCCLTHAAWSQTKSTTAAATSSVSLQQTPKVTMAVDQNIYTEQTKDGYFTQDKEAAIMGRVFPIPFEQMTADFNSGKAELKYDTLEKNILEIDGVTYLYLKQYTKREDSTVIIIFYCREHKDNTSLMISGYYPDGTDNQAMDVSIKAATLSAIVNQ